MRIRTVIQGPYERFNEDFLHKQADRDDPRSVFYRAMLKHRTYEAYLADVGSTAVELPGRIFSPVTGRDEVLYARRKGWIKDAG